ncbi:glycosyltransferase [Paraurantiacibacter namhicola]|uniref:Putative glycosyltransferase EpsF n=1 Tax=Paraurantiacibacter namhicola TaxID=645517 RepID=A0A1C7DA71_9SPHN|nr:glycosyltransferase [Paraurantiacibacter namhicola]ANU08354.1 Putative glycosyltransferase EpsF [Paraurantiacibacter namhicola]
MKPNQRPRMLHVHSGFDPGGKELRCVQLVRAFPKADHVIVSGDPERMGAARLLQGLGNVTFPKDFPALTGKPWPGRLKKIAAAMAGFDLILTYNWGAMDAAMAHTLFADVYRLPPLVHHEDGFNEDEAKRLKKRRNFFRRIALGRCAALVVPSETLERVALETWELPRTKVRRIPNGIDVGAFSRAPKADALPSLIKRKGEKWVGTLAGLRAVKNLPAMVRAFAALPEEWNLVIAGEGPERAAIEAEADRLGVEHRVHLPGFVDDPARIVGLFDIFALSSESEQQPISVIEAMAAGVPVAAPDVGDVAGMVAEEQAEFIVAPPVGENLAPALAALAGDDALRERLGKANKRKARAEYDAKTMIERYRALYWGIMGRNP